MAWTYKSNVIPFVGNGGDSLNPYFHPEDIVELLEQDTGIVAPRLLNVRYPNGPGGKQIWVLEAITDMDEENDSENPVSYEHANAIVILPCPPFNKRALVQLDEAGNEILP